MNKQHDDQATGPTRYGPSESQTKQKILLFIAGMILMLGLMYATSGDLFTLLGQKWYPTYEFNTALSELTDSLEFTNQALEQQLITEQLRVRQVQLGAEKLAVAYFLKGYSKSKTVKPGHIPSFIKSIEDDRWLLGAFAKHSHEYLDISVLNAINQALIKKGD